MPPLHGITGFSCGKGGRRERERERERERVFVCVFVWRGEVEGDRTSCMICARSYR